MSSSIYRSLKTTEHFVIAFFRIIFLHQPYIGLFERMLDDPDEALVQKYALQIFRTIGKYEPEIVERSLVLLKDKLQKASPVTKDQTIEAIRTIETFLRRTPSV